MSIGNVLVSASAATAWIVNIKQMKRVGSLSLQCLTPSAEPPLKSFENIKLNFAEGSLGRHY